MSTEKEGAAEPASLADWTIPRPEAIPRPTFAPAALAFGITIFFWGFVTSPVLLAVGLLVMAAALTLWVREMRHDD